MTHPNELPPGTQPSMMSVQDVQRAFQGQQIGAFGYSAGASGTVNAVGRVQTIIAHSTTGGTLTIDGGDSIPIPANVGFAFSPCGNLSNSTLVFSGTDMYLVELAL